MGALAFVDTETTGLDPDEHEIWEVGLIVRDSRGVEVDRVWQLPVNLGRADPMALRISRFHERRWEPGEDIDGIEGYPEHHPPDERWVVDPASMFVWAREFVSLIPVGAHIIGAIPSFDTDRLWRLLRRLGECPMWHYHIIDVEALAAGWLAGKGGGAHAFGQPPWKSDALSTAIGVDPETFDRHTALGDARWAQAIYDTIMGATDGR